MGANLIPHLVGPGQRSSFMIRLAHECFDKEYDYGYIVSIMKAANLLVGKYRYAQEDEMISKLLHHVQTQRKESTMGASENNHILKTDLPANLQGQFEVLDNIVLAIIDWRMADLKESSEMATTKTIDMLVDSANQAAETLDNNAKRVERNDCSTC